AVAGESGKPGSAMAYTHNVTVDLAENQIAARLDSVREACSSGRHGSCAPNIHQSARVTAIAQITFAKSLLRLRRFVVHRITPFVRLGIMGLHGYL
ncbi:MAG: hypothetical protein NW202_12915, partial [Nitrospira sp.]|nr:hypothetical protein [Nitrospira sp.]